MEKSGQGVGRCKFAFWFAVFHDVLGLLILLSGVFWDIFFNDLLIYSGAVVIFLSLIWWVFWYSGNIEVPPAELEDDITLYKKNKGISGVVRKVSDRLSNGLSSFRKSGRRSVPRGNSHQNGTNNANICMISYTNTQPLGPSYNLNREPLSI
ncbi:transmembrane protein 238-like [Pangasianodon hypophthalmus]|uniref:transmembrane protein 238-like n=1 Tax=Pangasianodon hypophthalmus TaxID=310915 RepID=UPI002307C18D|nr:transmembrane protein 238-like [Pangasianodon hypophthalmus]XP_053094608.1 transmembrane protein 238-like [Pangasianodon hypophthalmus]XP_053094609.1 transmembrane protein 238-like [Pangasianodon hypophthalmus]